MLNLEENNRTGHLSKVSAAFHPKSAFTVTGYPPSFVAFGTVALLRNAPFLLSLELNLWLLLESND